MMNYEEFKQAVEAEILNYMPEEYKDYEVIVRPMYKNNVTLDGLSFVNRASTTNVSPTFYLQRAYEIYKEESFDFEFAMEHVASVMVEGFKNAPVNSVEQLTFPEDKIVFQLINREQNEELLKDIPHREFLDLAIIYRYIYEISEEYGMATVLIHNNLAEKNGLSEEDLFRLAKENTERLLPITVKSMADTLIDMGIDDPELLELMGCCLNPMIIVTNSQKTHGSAALLYEEKLYELATQKDADLYIIPSSVHDLIILPADEYTTAESLADMVYEVNGNQVVVEERLSNQVYFYSRATRTITIVTDNNASLVDYSVA